MIRMLKTIHGWLGFFVMPWIIIIGLTGLYLNHSKLIYKYLPKPSYDEAQFDAWPDPLHLDEQAAKMVARSVFPLDEFNLKTQRKYHNRAVFIFQGTTGRVIVAEKTGHYWVKSRYTRKTYDPSGHLLATKIYWGSLFKTLHARGWATPWLGTWLADIAAGAMIVFGLSGIIMFLTPKIRGRKNRKVRAQTQIARSNVPRPQRIKLKD